MHELCIYPDVSFYTKARIVNRAEDVKRFVRETWNICKGDVDRATVEMSLGPSIDW